jgi:photosystem II stability/assembly factor-like uncharacterized protein
VKPNTCPLLLLCLATICGVWAQSWQLQPSGTDASLRGVSAVSSRIVWASGSKGTWLKTVDGGASWTKGQVAGAVDLDFRDVQGVSERVAYLMSAGSGAASRVYRTTDGGANWELLFTNPEASGFFDSFAFWNAKQGLLVGDPVGGRFSILKVEGGRVEFVKPGPEAVGKEGAFAASGTAIAVRGRGSACFVTGGEGGARVLCSRDGGLTWSAGQTPIRNEAAAAGVFSIAFHGRRSVVVGGNYSKDVETTGNVAVSDDGGRTWREPKSGRPTGFRSVVVYSKGVWIASGTSGSDISRDGGESWVRFDEGAFNAVSFAATGEGWAVGPKGRVARFMQSNVK